jgi:hypothetical protein
MEFLKKQLKRFDKKECFFYQNNKCIVGKSHCINCNLTIKRIDGIDSTKDYLSIITAKNLNNKNFWFSLFAFIFSFITLILKVLETIVSKPK